MLSSRYESLENIRLGKNSFIDFEEILFLRNKSFFLSWINIFNDIIHITNNSGEVLKSAAGELLAKMPEKGEAIRQLAYHLYTLCERKKWAEDARAYNELIGSWNAIVTASHEAGIRGEQTGLDF